MFQNAPAGSSDLTGLPTGPTQVVGGMMDQSVPMASMDIDMADMPVDMPGTDMTGQFSGIPVGATDVSLQGTKPPMDVVDNPLTGIGAGPLPAGFGLHTGSSTGSTLTEFTKRRNWSKLVLEEIKDLMLVLSPDARMKHISPSCKWLTGHDAAFLQSQFIAEFIHQEDRGMFSREFNESIASGNQLRFFYRFQKAGESGEYAIFEAFGHPHYGSEVLSDPHGKHGPRQCRGFFMISRPYPTKNAALLDSFLEHKIENERLTRRIEELKREEKEELEAQGQFWSRKDARSSTAPSEGHPTETRTDSDRTSQYDGMPPPPKPGTSNTALTKQNLNEALAASRPDTINDKMSRYEASSHIDGIEMFTGLRYRDGERSEGISTGAASPALIRGDVGIAILTDRDSRSNLDKKKKQKIADEYVCTDCGTLDSPEWRKGPNGPKTLCNACGLRWAKKEKKRQSSLGGSTQQASA